MNKIKLMYDIAKEMREKDISWNDIINTNFSFKEYQPMEEWSIKMRYNKAEKSWRA